MNGRMARLEETVLLTQVLTDVCLVVGKDTIRLHIGAGDSGLGGHSKALQINTLEPTRLYVPRECRSSSTQ